MSHPWSHYINELDQKFTENISDYFNRLYNDWFESKKEADPESIAHSDKFFMDLFIYHLFNANVKRIMRRCFHEIPNLTIDDVVNYANIFQEKEDRKCLQEFPITFDNEQLMLLLDQI